MKLQKVLRIAIAPLLFAAAISDVRAGVRLGDNTYVNLSLDGSIAYADNLFNSKARTSDMYATLMPGIVLTHDAANHFSVGFWESFVSHLDHGSLDSEYATANISYSFEPRAITGASEGGEGAGGRLRLSTNASFTQIAQNDNTYGYADAEGTWHQESGLVRRDIYSASASAQYAISAKLNGSLGLSWSYDHFSSYRERYNDSQSFSVPLSLHYNLALSQIGVVYNWSYTDIEQSRQQRRDRSGNPGNSTSHYLGLSYIGPVPFTSKLTLRADAGYTVRSLDDRWFSTDYTYDSDKKSGDYTYSTLGYNVALDWQVRGNIRATLSSGRNFEIGGRAQAITGTNVRLNVAAVLKTFYVLQGYVDYRLQEFDTNGITDRRDNLYSVGAMLGYSTYVPNLRSTVSVGVGYRFFVDDSNRIPNFYSNVVTFSFGIHY